MVTYWLPVCRRRLLEHNVVGVIQSVMESCNRSKPHVTLLKHASRTLRHLATDPECMAAVLPNPEAVNIMIELLRKHRENAELFKCVVQIFLLITCEETYCMVSSRERERAAC